MDFSHFTQFFLFAGSLIIIGAGVVLTFKTRFIQFRMIPQMFRLLGGMLFNKNSAKEGKHSIKSHKALFTAMSTTIGISTIVSPIIAMKLGGPGAILGFIVATLLGASINFAEVTFSLRYRKKLADGKILGGAMQYLQDEIAPFVAKTYAFFIFILMMAWSAVQANQLAEVLNSPFVGAFKIPNIATGLVIACLVIGVLIGGIKRVSDISAKLVPAMFCLYIGTSLWIIFCNLAKIPHAVGMMFSSVITPQALGSGAAVGGIVSALRWGVFKGIHSSEAGVGTQAIPHSMAETSAPVNQGVLAMLSTFTVCFLCILSSLVALVTEPWLDGTVSLGINMVAKSYQQYFSYWGIIVLMISAFLFAFGTMVGNSFNGSQCFSYLSRGKYLKFYYLTTAVVIFFGTLAPIAFIWSNVDLILIPAVLINTLSIVYLSFKRKELLSEVKMLPAKAEEDTSLDNMAFKE